jgi:hypothetical protein
LVLIVDRPFLHKNGALIDDYYIKQNGAKQDGPLRAVTKTAEGLGKPPNQCSWSHTIGYPSNHILFMTN